MGKGVWPRDLLLAVSSWHDYFETTHLSHEFRLSHRTTGDCVALSGVLGGLRHQGRHEFPTKTFPPALPRTCVPCTPAGTRSASETWFPPVNAQRPERPQRLRQLRRGHQRGYHQTAVFTSVDYDLIPKVLTLTGGTRYYSYTETFCGSQYSTSTGCAGVANGKCLGPPSRANHDADYSGFRSRGNLTWHITPDMMVYYTFSQGFRPGAVNRQDAPRSGWPRRVVPRRLTPAVGPARARASQAVRQAQRVSARHADQQRDRLEVRVLRSSAAGQRLGVHHGLGQRADADLQPPIYGNTTFGVEGPDYRIKGLELQIVGRVTDGLTLQGSVSDNSASQETRRASGRPTRWRRIRLRSAVASPSIITVR